MNAFATLTQLLRQSIPQDCFICGLPSADNLLCAGCLDDLPALPLHRCPSCATPTPAGETCGACLADPPHFDATLAAFAYRFPIEPIIGALKYRAQLHAAPFLARMLAGTFERPSADCIIPMPLHPKRLVERGFNQSAELARRLGQTWRIPVRMHDCVRDRHTPPQAQLNGAARRKNVKGAFRATADFTGQHILVIDDVMTTGSTLDELARALKSRGARKVTNCVIARTLTTLGDDLA